MPGRLRWERVLEAIHGALEIGERFERDRREVIAEDRHQEFCVQPHRREYVVLLRANGGFEARVKGRAPLRARWRRRAHGRIHTGPRRR